MEPGVKAEPVAKAAPSVKAELAVKAEPGVRAPGVKAEPGVQTWDDSHMVSCRISGCVICRRIKLFRGWAEQLPWIDTCRLGLAVGMVPRGVGTGSWLRIRKCGEEDKWELSCAACQCVIEHWPHRKDATVFGHLKQHVGTNKHRHNVTAALQLDTDDIGRPIDVGLCPPSTDFLCVWDDFGAGKVTSTDSKHRRDMVKSLNTAVMEISKEALQAATTICLMRDERLQRLLVRFSCCSADLTVSSGVLGLAKNFGTGHAAITAATETMFIRLCHGDSELAKSVMQRVELLCVDAASDELLSGESMRGHAGEALPACTPNLKVIARDAAHASRRFLSRLWKADDEIVSTLSTFVRTRQSITQRIHRSQVFTAWFGEEVARDGGTCRNLRAAKHRFESYATPLARICQHLPAVVRTAERIVIERGPGSDEGKDAATFLEQLTPHTAMMLAMLADAADEMLMFTRLCDTENLDSAELHLQLETSIARATLLFCREQCLSIPECHAARMHALLRSNTVSFMVTRGRTSFPKCLGKPDAATVQGCLGLLSRWVGMLRASAEAEFPNFTLLAAFSVFNVSTAVHADHQEDALATQRLAQVFEVSHDALMRDLKKWRPVAARHRRTMGVGNKEAWGIALRKVIQSRGWGSGDPDLPTALVVVLARYLAWSASTSRIEQTFSSMDRTMQFRGHATAAFEESLLRLASAKADAADGGQAIAKRAQALWSAQTDRRKHTAGRFDNGVKRGPVAKSEATSVAKRRRAVGLAVASAAPAAAADDAMQLPPSLQEELQFQKEKLMQHKVEALRNGCLLPAEIDEDLETAMREHLTNVAKRAHDRATGVDRKERLTGVHALDWNALRGRHAFVRREGLDDVAAVSVACLERGMTLTDDIAAADVFVVVNVTDPGDKIRLWAGAKGLLVMSATRVLHDLGPFLRLERASRLRRRIWATDAWRERHSYLWSIIVGIAQARNTGWVVAVSLESLQAHAAKASTAKSETVLLDVAAGRIAADPAGVEPIGQKSFLRSVFVVDRGASCL